MKGPETKWQRTASQYYESTLTPVLSQFMFCLFSSLLVRTRRTWFQAVKKRALSPHNLLSLFGVVWSHAIVFIFISPYLMGRRYTWCDGVLVPFIFHTTVMEGVLGLLSFFPYLCFRVFYGTSSYVRRTPCPKSIFVFNQKWHRCSETKHGAPQMAKKHFLFLF